MEQKAKNKKEESKTGIGRTAEERAQAYLESNKGYVLVVRNFRWKRGEADLIMITPEGALALIEVRSACSRSPWLRYSITPRKWKHLTQTLDVFLYKEPRFRRCPRRIELFWCDGETMEHWPQPV